MLIWVDHVQAGGGDTAYRSCHNTRLYEGFNHGTLCCTGLSKAGRRGQTDATAEGHIAIQTAEADAAHEAMPSTSVEPVGPAPLVEEGKSEVQAATADIVTLPAGADMVGSKPDADVA